MAAHNPNQNASSFRPVAVGGSDSVDRNSSPPFMPFALSPDNNASNSAGGSSTLSSKSSSFSSNHQGGPGAAGAGSGDTTPNRRSKAQSHNHHLHRSRRKLAQDIHNRALSKKALLENDSMVYLDGPQVYTCANCRTHLTSHDDIISKSFHGRHGRAYLFDQCVNITTGPAEDRFLMTGLHSVNDLFCKRCQTLVGWTYSKAYEQSQKYKEGKFIIEKINLHLEESDYYDVDRPAGERGDKWRVRSMSWGSERSLSVGSYGEAHAYSPGMGSPSGVMSGIPPGGLYHGSRDRSGSGSSNYSSSYHRAPQTPTRRSPAAAMMSPKSPRTPGDIIYEYRQSD